MSTLTLSPGLYDIRGKIGFLGYQSKSYAYFIELYNDSGKEYCCKKGRRHPAAGMYVRKTTARKLKANEVTPKMMMQWDKRIKQACGFVMNRGCKRKN
jgi:hypothetical protein